jgi:hypothetical protein
LNRWAAVDVGLGPDFSAGFLFLSMTFVVSRPPYREGDTWRMVVDGVALTRAH